MSRRKSEIGLSGALRRAETEELKQTERLGAGGGRLGLPSLPGVGERREREEEAVPDVEALRKELGELEFTFKNLRFEQKYAFFERSQAGQALSDLNNPNSARRILSFRESHEDLMEDVKWWRNQALSRENDAIFKRGKDIEKIFASAKDEEDPVELEKHLARIRRLLPLYERMVRSFEEKVREEERLRAEARAEEKVKEKNTYEQSLPGRFEALSHNMYALSDRIRGCERRLRYERVAHAATSDKKNDEAHEFLVALERLMKEMGDYHAAQKEIALGALGEDASYLDREKIRDHRAFIANGDEQIAQGEKKLNAFTKQYQRLESAFLAFEKSLEGIFLPPDKISRIGMWGALPEPAFTRRERESIPRMPSNDKELTRWEIDERHHAEGLSQEEERTLLQDARHDFASWFYSDPSRKTLSSASFKAEVDAFLEHRPDFSGRLRERVREALLGLESTYLREETSYRTREYIDYED